jgi:acyl-coenzyme A synthetase/AMP-(fatty) acid ligase
VDLLLRERITVWYSVPSAIVAMIDDGGLLGVDAPMLRAVLFAGEVFPIRYVRLLRRRFPRARLLNLYGPTETNVCAFSEVGDVSDDRVAPAPIGRACAGDRIWARTEDGREAAMGEEGELVVEGPTVMMGYRGAPPHAGPYATGDIVRLDADGYSFLGRRDAMIKLRGHRIEPGEVEAALVAHPSVREAGVVTVGQGLRARLVAYVVADREGPSTIAIKRHCAALLPRHMIVDEVVVVPALPRTPNGKMDRRALAASAAETHKE